MLGRLSVVDRLCCERKSPPLRNRLRRTAVAVRSRSRRHSAFYPARLTTVAAASSITDATSVGCESKDMWLELSRVVVFATIRLASAAWSSGLTTRSSDSRRSAFLPARRPSLTCGRRPVQPCHPKACSQSFWSCSRPHSFWRSHFLSPAGPSDQSMPDS